MRRIRFSGLTLAIVLAACSGSSAADDGSGKPAVADNDIEPQVVFSTAKGDIIVTVEVADSQPEWSKGLMNRSSLAADHGMIFIFPVEDVKSFWMKNTLIPLDMIFVNKNLEVVGVVADAEPETTTPREVDAVSTYVIEVNGGFARANGISAGTHMSLRGIP